MGSIELLYLSGHYFQCLPEVRCPVLDGYLQAKCPLKKGVGGTRSDIRY